jgi:hypothetical protein
MACDASLRQENVRTSGLIVDSNVENDELSLHDRQPHGLVVRIRLAVHQQSERSAA